MYKSELHYLNIGQGDCTIILIRNSENNDIVRTVVYDCGSGSQSGSTAKFLQKCKDLEIQSIDIAIISHFDKDHYLGFSGSLQKGISKNGDAMRLFKSTNFYTTGCIYAKQTYKPDPSHLLVSRHVGPLNVTPRLLSSFRFYESLLIRFNKFKSKDTSRTLIHKTERVFSGYPGGNWSEDAGGDYLVLNREWEPTVKGDDKDFGEVTIGKNKKENVLQVRFLPSHTDEILGKDLINLDLPALEGVHLYCIAYNRKILTNFTPGGHDYTSDKDGEVANAKSICCVFKHGELSAWFGGDIISAYENKLTTSIKNIAGENGVTILKASHHGAGTSTDKDFINQLTPDYVVITCGQGTSKTNGKATERNQHNHPSFGLINNLKNYFKDLNLSSDSKKGTYTTWMSRANGSRTNYMTPNGTAHIYITESDICFRGTESGEVSPPECNLPERSIFDKKINKYYSYNDLEEEKEIILKNLRSGLSKQEVINRIKYKFTLNKRAFHGFQKMEVDITDDTTRKKRKFETIVAEGDLVPAVQGRDKKRRIDDPKTILQKKFKENKVLLTKDICNFYFQRFLSQKYGEKIELIIKDQKKMNDYTYLKGVIPSGLQIPGFSTLLQDFTIEALVYGEDNSQTVKFQGISAVLQCDPEGIPLSLSSDTERGVMFLESKMLSYDRVLSAYKVLNIDNDRFSKMLSILDFKESKIAIRLDVLSGKLTSDIEHILVPEQHSLKLPGISGISTLVLVYDSVKCTVHSSARTKDDIYYSEHISGSGVLSVKNQESQAFQYQFEVDGDSIFSITIGPNNEEDPSFPEILATLGLLNDAQEHSVIKGFPILQEVKFERFSAEFDVKNNFTPRNISLQCSVESDSTIAELGLNGFFTSYEHSYRCTIAYHNIGAKKNHELLSKEFNILPMHLTIRNIEVNAEMITGDFEVSLEIETDWAFELGNEKFLLGDLVFEIYRSDSSIGASVSAQFTFASIDFSLQGSVNDITHIDKGWLFESRVAANHAIHISDLIKELCKLFNTAVPSHIQQFDMTIEDIRISFQSIEHHFNLSGRVTLNSPLGPIEKGNLNIEIDLKKNPDTGKHDFTMNLNGQAILELDQDGEKKEFELDVKADDIGRPDWSVELKFTKESKEGLNLLGIATLFDTDFVLPKEFPLEVKGLFLLDQLTLLYQNGTPDTDTTFSLSAQIGSESKIGAILSGRKTQDGKWHFLFGGYFEKIPDNSIVSKTLKHLKIEEVWILFNTADENANQWPPLPDGFPKGIGQHPLKKGLLAATTLELANNPNSNLKSISSFLPTSTSGNKPADLLLLADITIQPFSAHIEAMLDGDVHIPTTRGHSLDVKNAFLRFDVSADNIGLAVHGEINFTLDNRSMTAMAELHVNTEGISAEVGFKCPDGLPLFGQDTLLLKEFDLELGVDFEPPGLRFGIISKILWNQNSFDFGLVMEFVGPVPNPEYVDIEIEKLDFTQFLDAFVKEKKKGHKIIGKHIAELEDVSLVWAEKPITLPDGKQAQEGFGFHGAVEFFKKDDDPNAGWGAYLAVDVHPTTGISGEGQMSPVHLGPITITGSGPGMSITEQLDESTGQWHKVKNVAIHDNGTSPLLLKGDNTPVKTRERQLIKPGGAYIYFNSNHSPYLKMGIALSLFGIRLAEVDADVEEDKMHLLVFIKIPVIAQFKLKVDLLKGDNPGFDVAGSFFLGLDIKFDIPLVFTTIHVHIQVGIDAGLEIALSRKDGFELKITGGLDFMGKRLEFANLDFKVPPESLEQLPQWVLHYILTGEVPHFKKKIDDGSGKNQNDDYSGAKREKAQEFLVRVSEWADFVHKDVAELNREEALSDEQIIELTNRIIFQTGGIVLESDKSVYEINANATDEVARLNELHPSKTSKNTTHANTWRKIEIERMQRDIDDIKDLDGKLRKAIEAIWSKVDNLGLLPIDYIKNELHTLKAILSEDGIYSEQGYSPAAVDHFAYLVEQERTAHLFQAEVLSTAESHAQSILDDAHQPATYVKITQKESLTPSNCKKK